MSRDEVKHLIESASNLELELVWLPKIMVNQTDEEIVKMGTISDNKIGLNSRDAPIVTAYYMRVKRGVHLIDRQAIVLKDILPKYWRQFARMMNDGK